MERVQVLINKLVQQARANESAAQLLNTVQLLQTELVQLQKQKETFSSRKVAVVMPANFAAPQQNEPSTTAPAVEKYAPIPQPVAPQKEKETFINAQEKTAPQPAAEVPAPIVQAPKQEAEKKKEVPPQKDLFGNEAYTLKRPAVTLPDEEAAAPVQPLFQNAVEVVPPHPVTTPPPAEPQPFDALAETPTLLQHLPPQAQTPKEINQLIATQQPSLNDRLKQEKVELAHKLKEAPIKDLRKAIGINDRFVFVNELFRGDEVMYERSIKTINSFHILQEAEYWMNRELKVKLGWSDTKDTVQHFYALVRRRFS